MAAPRSLYAAFDRFPSAKGAATHIDVAARALFAHSGPGLLYVLGDDRLPARQVEDGGTEIVRFAGAPGSLLERGVAFGRRLSALLHARGAQLELVQVRDPWGGVPVLAHDGDFDVVYELNGLPSIELPAHRPHMAPRTVAKLAAAERFCLERADAVVCPSRPLAAAAAARGADPARVHIVPNGAHPVPKRARPADAPARYLLYFGALQPWQGVETLLRAFAELRDLTDLGLVICGSQHGRQAKPLRKLAHRLGIADRLIWRFELRREDLAPWLAHAALTVAPLTDCPRNTEQGCAPLKLLESLAAGVPVVASDLPAVREIVRHGHEGLLVAPDRPGALARALRLALDDPSALAAMGGRGRATWARRFTWSRSAAAQRAVYEQLHISQEVAA